MVTREEAVMPDDMFFSPDKKSLRRGKRIEARTHTARPCLLWPKDAPEIQLQGVVVNINPYGMLIRMVDSVPPGTEVIIQLMRDEDFADALAEPVEGKVVRNTSQTGGYTDHGVKVTQKEIRRIQRKPVHVKKRRPRPARKTRMHTIDITVGEQGRRRPER